MQYEATGVVLLRGCRVEARHEGRSELPELRGPGRRRSQRRHRTHTELLDDALPGGGIGTRIGEVRLIECQRCARRQWIARVVTTDAVLRHHRLVIDGSIRV